MAAKKNHNYELMKEACSTEAHHSLSHHSWFQLHIQTDFSKEISVGAPLKAVDIIDTDYWWCESEMKNKKPEQNKVLKKRQITSTFESPSFSSAFCFQTVSQVGLLQISWISWCFYRVTFFFSPCFCIISTPPHCLTALLWCSPFWILSKPHTHTIQPWLMRLIYHLPPPLLCRLDKAAFGRTKTVLCSPGNQVSKRRKKKNKLNILYKISLWSQPPEIVFWEISQGGQPSR